MQFGQGSISTVQNKLSGAPFAANSAENGVSIDPVTGRVVLGNDVAAVLAQLLSNREIPMQDFFLRLLGINEETGQFIVSSGNISDGLLFNAVPKVEIEGSLITKRAIATTESTGVVNLDPINDSFGIFHGNLPPP